MPENRKDPTYVCIFLREIIEEPSLDLTFYIVRVRV